MEERSFSPVVQQSLSGCCVTPLKRIITPLSYMKKTVDPWCWFHVAVTETISNFTLFFPFKWNPNRREIEPTLIAVMQKQLFIVREPFSLHANCTCSLFSLQPGSESGVGIIIAWAGWRHWQLFCFWTETGTMLVIPAASCCAFHRHPESERALQGVAAWSLMEDTSRCAQQNEPDRKSAPQVHVIKKLPLLVFWASAELKRKSSDSNWTSGLIYILQNIIRFP